MTNNLAEYKAPKGNKFFVKMDLNSNKIECSCPNFYKTKHCKHVLDYTINDSRNAVTVHMSHKDIQHDGKLSKMDSAIEMALRMYNNNAGGQQ